MTILNKVSNKSLMTGVTPIADVPDAPTIGTATDVGTSRAYNNGAATVAYTGAATGGAATTFTATSTPGSFTATGSSPITVTGLQSATAYTFTVSAANAAATKVSSSSSSITATTVPQAPTIGTATDGGTGTTVSIPFTAGATGGSTITSYSIVSSPATTTQTTSSSPYTFTGLTAGTAYTFQVAATNANGTSSYSAASNSVTPVVPSSFYSIATVTAAGGETSLSFTSIPGTYKSLQIRGLAKTTYSTANSNNYVTISFNSDVTSSYANHDLTGSNSNAFAEGTASGGGALAAVRFASTNSYTGVPSQAYGAFIVDVIDYASSSKYKTVRSFAGRDTNGATSSGAGVDGISLSSSLWTNTAAVTTITLLLAGQAMAAGSTFALYGVK